LKSSGTRVRRCKKNCEDGDLKDLVSATDLAMFSGKCGEEVGPRSGVTSGVGCADAARDYEAFPALVKLMAKTPEKARGGDGFEIDKTLPANATDLRSSPASDAGDERAQDERSDDDFENGGKISLRTRSWLGKRG